MGARFFAAGKVASVSPSPIGKRIHGEDTRCQAGPGSAESDRFVGRRISRQAHQGSRQAGGPGVRGRRPTPYFGCLSFRPKRCDAKNSATAATRCDSTSTISFASGPARVLPMTAFDQPCAEKGSSIVGMCDQSQPRKLAKKTSNPVNADFFKLVGS